jgi:glycosyltransferase involved in cell wall biosynthesis
VLILTRNEEADLPQCLQSVAWCDDVHVFDSHSTDRTVEIARQAGATVTQRAFDNFAAQRNAALEQLVFKHRWVLILDADERIPRELAAEMHLFVGEAPDRVAAARLRRRDFLYGTWLKHAQLSPYYIRLVRTNRVRYEREVNEVIKVDGEVVQLHEPFDHYPFSKGMWHWIAKHNVYSTMEAEQSLRVRRGMTKGSIRQALFCRDFNERRVHQKALFYRMPFRPLVRFLYSYFVRMGVLDGRAGLTYALLQGFYEYFIVLKTRELEAERSVPTAQAPAQTPVVQTSTPPLTPG